MTTLFVIEVKLKDRTGWTGWERWTSEEPARKAFLSLNGHPDYRAVRLLVQVELDRSEWSRAD